MAKQTLKDDNVIMYSAADKNSPVAANLKKGDVIEYISSKCISDVKWVELKLSNGHTGFSVQPISVCLTKKAFLCEPSAIVYEINEGNIVEKTNYLEGTEFYTWGVFELNGKDWVRIRDKNGNDWLMDGKARVNFVDSFPSELPSWSDEIQKLRASKEFPAIVPLRVQLREIPKVSLILGMLGAPTPGQTTKYELKQPKRCCLCGINQGSKVLILEHKEQIGLYDFSVQTREFKFAYCPQCAAELKEIQGVHLFGCSKVSGAEHGIVRIAFKNPRMAEEFAQLNRAVVDESYYAFATKVTGTPRNVQIDFKRVWNLRVVDIYIDNLLRDKLDMRKDFSRVLTLDPGEHTFKMGLSIFNIDIQPGSKYVIKVLRSAMRGFVFKSTIVT